MIESSVMSFKNVLGIPGAMIELLNAGRPGSDPRTLSFSGSAMRI